MELIKHFFQADHNSLLWWEMCLRGVLTYLITIFTIRWGDRRVLGNMGIFDIAFLIIYGSLISRGITGNASFSATLATCFAMVITHKIISYITFKSTKAGKLFKGSSVTVVKDGKYSYELMRKNLLTEEDIKEAMRLHANTDNLEKVKEAVFERSGKISIIK